MAKLPKTQALREKYKDRGLVVIGVHTQELSENLTKFLETHPITFPIAVDTSETGKSYGIEAWPTDFLIDRTGHSQ